MNEGFLVVPLQPYYSIQVCVSRRNIYPGIFTLFQPYTKVTWLKKFCRKKGSEHESVNPTV